MRGEFRKVALIRITTVENLHTCQPFHPHTFIYEFFQTDENKKLYDEKFNAEIFF